MNLAASRRKLFLLQVGAPVATVLLLLAGAYWLVSLQLRNQVETRLRETAQAIGFSVEFENGVVEFEESAYLAQREGRIDLGKDAVAQWLDLDGRLVRSQGRLQLPSFPLEDEQTHYVSGACVYTLRVSARGVPFGYVRVGQSLAPMQKELRGVLLLLLAAGSGLVGALALLSWWWTGRALRPVQQAYDELAAFSGSVAHELRTPITALHTNAQSLTRHFSQLSSDEIQQGLGELASVSEDMARIVNDMLLLSQLNRAEPLPLETVALDALVSETVEKLQPLARKRGVALECSTATVAVSGNPGAIRNLVGNLIENALYYTDKGGLVQVGCDSAGELWVEDNGVGMKADQIDSIFEPFWRGETSRARHLGGAGLGLAIVRRCARVCQAELGVTSVVGNGSRFWCRFRQG